MAKTLALIGMEIRRTLANGRYILFTIAWPVVFYLLFTSIYGGGSLDRLSVNRFLLVSMAAYGGLGAAFNANSTRLSMERASGWVRQLRATPLGAGAYVIGKTVMAALVVLPSLVAVGLAGVVFHHVSMPAGMWLRLGLALWLGTLPFALLGILVGYLFDSQTASSASTIIYLGLSLLGGLWIPIQVMPTALRDVARWTPSYRYADLGWRVLAGQAPSAADLVILGAYTLLFALAAARRYRLDEAREYA